MSRSDGPSSRIEAARRGEAWAQDELSREIRELAHVVCHPRSARSTFGDFDWEDVAQEAARRLFAVGLSLYRGSGSERSYLYSFVKVAWLQALRSRRRRDQRERNTQQESGVTDPDTQTFELSSLLDRLDPDCQQLLREVHLEGVTYSELARRNEIEESSVRAKTSRCLSKLRDLARKEEG